MSRDFGTYRPEDVEILLKDITGLVAPLPASEREKIIQGGGHYSEMLPLEYRPTAEYMNAYKDALARFGKTTARAVGAVAEKIWQAHGGKVALVSLARAGTPIGILIKRYLLKKYRVAVAHYTISIIRGRGIDKNAVDYILRRHAPETVRFVDGWTGKGAIQRQLELAMTDCPEIDSGLAVLSDPARVAKFCGTTEDFLIPSSCLNSTVSGLLSRTFLRGDIIGEKDFHGAAFYRELADEDLTYEFINAVEKDFDFDAKIFPDEPTGANRRGLDEVKEIAEVFKIDDINLVKPGIGEATRVLLRRVPEKILVRSLRDDERLGHIYRLAKEKGVEVVEYPLKNYRACGLIRALRDL